MGSFRSLALEIPMHRGYGSRAIIPCNNCGSLRSRRQSQYPWYGRAGTRIPKAGLTGVVWLENIGLNSICNSCSFRTERSADQVSDNRLEAGILDSPDSAQTQSWVRLVRKTRKCFAGHGTFKRTPERGGFPDMKRTCPQCRSSSLMRSHRRNFVERFLSIVQVLPYRCEDCNHRFFVLRRGQHAPVVGAAGGPPGVKATHYGGQPDK